jgi:hypothetical protein
MTPVEFLVFDPFDHPDFVPNDHPRWEDVDGSGREGLGVSMPHLAALIDRIGGPGAIPEVPAGTDPYDLEPDDIVVARVGAEEMLVGRRRGCCAVRLRDGVTGRVHAELTRLDGGRLRVAEWHPRREELLLIFDIPAARTAAWGIPIVAIGDISSISPDLDRLAAEALDYWLGVIRASGESYIDAGLEQPVS